MRVLLMVCVLALTACTKNMEYAWEREVKAWEKYDLKTTLKDFVGISQIDEKHLPREQNAPPIPPKMNCVSDPAHQRVITANGINDESGYTKCQHSDAPMVPVKRWAGK